jgi:hypothetical protein
MKKTVHPPLSIKSCGEHWYPCNRKAWWHDKPLPQSAISVMVSSHFAIFPFSHVLNQNLHLHLFIWFLFICGVHMDLGTILRGVFG